MNTTTTQRAKNIAELAELLHTETYTHGTTGQQAIIAMLQDVAHQFDTQPDTSDVFDWLDNEDGTRATLADVITAIASLAQRYEHENKMNTTQDTP